MRRNRTTPYGEPEWHANRDNFGLPQFVDVPGRMLELFVGGDEGEDWTGHKVLRLENSINTRFRDEILPGIGKLAGQLTRRLFWMS